MVFALLLLLAASSAFDESFRAGLLALQRNDLPAAAANLGTAAKLEPNNGRVWIALAQTYRKMRETAQADDSAAKALSFGAADALVLKTLVIYFSESTQVAKAADAQARLAVLTPQDAGAREKAEALYFSAVQPLLQQQKFGDALVLLNQARERIQNSAQLELATGVACYGLRRFDEAAGAFLRTIAIAPETEQPYIFLGRFLGQIPGRLPEVTRQFLRFEHAHPENAAGYLLHAKALNAQSIEPETARSLLEKAIAIKERDASAHFELGTVLERLHLYNDAERELKRSAEIDPADPAIHYRLARVYERLGKSDEASAERAIHAKLLEDSVR